MRITLLSFLVLGALIAGCGDAEKMENLQREKTSLEAKVKRLESKIEKLETAPKENAKPEETEAAASPEGDPACEKKLTDCIKRVETCERDPFTGTKYLTGDPK